MSRGTGVRLGGAALLLLTLAVVVAEVLVGHAIRGRIVTAIERRTGTDVSVDIGSRPALLDLVSSEIPVLTMSAGGVCGVEGISVSASLDGVEIGTPVAYDASSVSVGVSVAAIEELLARSPKGPLLERIGAELVADPADGELLLRGGPGGILEVPLRPVLHDETLSLGPRQARVMGRPVPAGAAKRLGKVEAPPRRLGDLPLGLRPTKVQVTAEGVELDLRGGPQRLDAAAIPDPEGICKKQA